MKAFSSFALLAVLALGCASNSASPGSGIGGERSILRSTSATHYRLLSDPRHIREIDWSRPPQALHVKGQLISSGFEPAGSVEGRGGLCEGGTDWVSLRDGQFHAAASGSPQGPYVLGCKGRTGAFVPASREVVR